MNIIYVGVPSTGGGYSHFCHLKEKLKNYNFFLLSLGDNNEINHYEDEAYINIGKELSRIHHKKDLAQLFINFIIENKIDIVIPNNSPIVVSCLPFLPSNVKVVYRVNSDTPRVYKYVTTHIDSISKIVCISPIQVQKLKKNNSEVRKKIRLIPHGLNVPDKFNINSVSKGKLQIGFLGRIHDGHKRVLLIPEILKTLKSAYDLHIVGDGPDKEELLNLLDQYNIPYTYHGFIRNTDIGPIVSLWDIMLFPSVVEGFGLTLIETMQYGVVPIANRLDGITDYVIEDEKSGFLINKNDITSYANVLERLNADRVLLLKTKQQAHLRVKNKFNLDEVCDEYDQIFHEALLYKKPKKKDFKEWKPYAEYKPNILQRITNRLKFLFNTLK